MSEAPATEAPPATDNDGTDDAPDTGTPDLAADVEKWKSLARKHEERAKTNATAARELEKLRQSAMTEQEKAVAEAEKRGRDAASTAAGLRLARAEFRAEAAGAADKATVDSFLEYADMSKFIGEDGEPDAKAITAAVKRLAGSGQVPDFDGGARTTAKPNDMNAFIRRQAGV